MKRLIYYPDFEVSDETWLKFALLYLEQINPIIPFSGERYLSKQFKELIQSTDLIQPIRPQFNDGRDSSLDAILSLEKVLTNPQRFSSIFRTSNILGKWQLRESHDTELFIEKYSYDFYRFCTDSKIATVSSEGMKVPKEVATFICVFLLTQLEKQMVLKL